MPLEFDNEYKGPLGMDHQQHDVLNGQATKCRSRCCLWRQKAFAGPNSYSCQQRAGNQVVCRGRPIIRCVTGCRRQGLQTGNSNRRLNRNVRLRASRLEIYAHLRHFRQQVTMTRSRHRAELDAPPQANELSVASGNVWSQW